MKNNDKVFKGIFSLSTKGYLESHNKKKLDKETVKKLVEKSVENYNNKFSPDIIISLFNIPDDKQVMIHTNKFKIECDSYAFNDKNITMNLLLKFNR